MHKPWGTYTSSAVSTETTGKCPNMATGQTCSCPVTVELKTQNMVTRALGEESGPIAWGGLMQKGWKGGKVRRREEQRNEGRDGMRRDGKREEDRRWGEKGWEGRRMEENEGEWMGGGEGTPQSPS